MKLPPNTDLCAFLDQECTAGKRRQIDAALCASPPLAERAASWRRNDAALRTALLPDSSPGRRHPAERLLRRMAEQEPSTTPLLEGGAGAVPPYGGMALIAFGGGCISLLLAVSLLAAAVQ